MEEVPHVRTWCLFNLYFVCYVDEVYFQISLMVRRLILAVVLKQATNTPFKNTNCKNLGHRLSFKQYLHNVPIHPK